MIIKKKLYLYIILFLGVFGIHKLYAKGFQGGMAYVLIYTGILFAGGWSILFAGAEFLWVLLFKPAIHGYISIS